MINTQRIMMMAMGLLLCLQQNAIAASCTCATVSGPCESVCTSVSVGCQTYTCPSTGVIGCNRTGLADLSSCDDTADCVKPTTDWADVSGTDYQMRDYCNSKIGVTTTQYRCKTGYYGDCSTCSTIPTCTRCPSYSIGAIIGYGTTANAGATSAAECYISAGGSFSDDVGSGTYSSDCYYTE